MQCRTLLEKNIKNYKFSAAGLIFGIWPAESQTLAQEAYAKEYGYTGWQDLVDKQEAEFGVLLVDVVEAE